MIALQVGLWEAVSVLRDGVSVIELAETAWHADREGRSRCCRLYGQECHETLLRCATKKFRTPKRRMKMGVYAGLNKRSDFYYAEDLGDRNISKKKKTEVYRRKGGRERLRKRVQM